MNGPATLFPELRLPANLPVFGEAHSMTVNLGSPLKTKRRKRGNMFLSFVIAVNCRDGELFRPTTPREGPTVSEKPLEHNG